MAMSCSRRCFPVMRCRTMLLDYVVPRKFSDLIFRVVFRV